MSTTIADDRRVVEIGPEGLEGLLISPAGARALVLFVHGSGSSRLSPRNARVAEGLEAHGLASLRFDLLNADEACDRARVFDIPLLARRVLEALQWLERQEGMAGLAFGLFGASTGAAAALVAAAKEPDRVGAIVARGGRPDLAGAALEHVRAPTLLIVGSADRDVLALNQQALTRLGCRKSLAVVPGATHLFEEPGALERVTLLAGDWFARHLTG